jgi:hypothetical protein
MSAFEGSREREGGTVFGIGPIVGRVLGVLLDEDEIRRREMALPLQKAKIGAQTIREGLERDDVELRSLGAAMVTSALIEVEDPEKIIVPPDVSEGVKHIAAAIPIKDVTNNPYISETDASKAATILEESKYLP